ncbi:MAG: ParD-like family protein [Arenicella sp.]
MGILKVTDLLHDEIRKSSKAMSRSINAQAEFWIKVGRLCEMNPTLNYQEILREYLLANERVDSERDNNEQDHNKK